MSKQKLIKPITVRVTDSDYRKLETLAAKHNEPLSEYIRSCVLSQNRRKDAIYCRESKSSIRNIQTSLNMLHQGIDTENQTKKILMEVEHLCSLLK